MPTEHMMVAFGMTSPPTVLYFQGKAIEFCFDTDPGGFVDSIEDQHSGLGVLVWSGEPKEVLLQGAYKGLDFSGGAWRPPTDAEWQALRENRMPFDPQVPQG
jgi:hypothetical protein